MVVFWNFWENTWRLVFSMEEKSFCVYIVILEERKVCKDWKDITCTERMHFVGTIVFKSHERIMYV